MFSSSEVNISLNKKHNQLISISLKNSKDRYNEGIQELMHTIGQHAHPWSLVRTQKQKWCTHRTVVHWWIDRKNSNAACNVKEHWHNQPLEILNRKSVWGWWRVEYNAHATQRMLYLSLVSGRIEIWNQCYMANWTVWRILNALSLKLGWDSVSTGPKFRVNLRKPKWINIGGYWYSVTYNHHS